LELEKKNVLNDTALCFSHAEFSLLTTTTTTTTTSVSHLTGKDGRQLTEFTEQILRAILNLIYPEVLRMS